MPRSRDLTVPRGDPLDGWKRDNLAAPKPAAQEGYGYQATVYDDTTSGAVQQSIYDALPSVMDQKPPNPPSPPSLPLPLSSLQSKQTPSVERAEKGITEVEKAACPLGDTRWPPPNTIHTKPLQLLLDDKGEKRIYYHLIHNNDASEARFWEKEIQAKASSSFAAKFPAAHPTDTSHMSASAIQQANEQVAFEEKGKLRNAIVAAKLQKKMREVSHGPRGTLWLLEEEIIEVWKCIENLQMGTTDKVVRIGAVVEKYAIFGVGLKAEKDHVLLLGQKMDG